MGAPASLPFPSHCSLYTLRTPHPPPVMLPLSVPNLFFPPRTQSTLPAVTTTPPGLAQASWDTAVMGCTFLGRSEFLPNMIPSKWSLPHAEQLPGNLSVTCHHPQPRRWQVANRYLEASWLGHSRAFPFYSLPKTRSFNHPACGIHTPP